MKGNQGRGPEHLSCAWKTTAEEVRQTQDTWKGTAERGNSMCKTSKQAKLDCSETVDTMFIGNYVRRNSQNEIGEDNRDTAHRKM